ncbi:MAG: hypothetical protein CMM58_01845 [Rhodospirillaceae bacterium]|nr:hypothetical protein [Rhodospirillaceae bacterium]|tara:strand:+ start:3616 stop:3954 length:339 start_codon:yes stop_codon:yes gene_type:complete
MSQIDPLDRRALGILSRAMNKQLGVSNLVSREVSRAFETGKLKDKNRAGLLFDSLPGWQKIEVQREADDQAYILMEQKKSNTGREWNISKLEGKKNVLPDNFSTRLPTFLVE